MRLIIIATLLRMENPVRVKVVAPATSNNFCQFEEIDLRKIEPKWLESSAKRGILETTAFTRLMIGFLRRILSKIPIVYWLS